MSSYQPGFCFEEPFSKRKAWTFPEIMSDPHIFLFPPKKRLKREQNSQQMLSANNWHPNRGERISKARREKSQIRVFIYLQNSITYHSWSWRRIRWKHHRFIKRGTSSPKPRMEVCLSTLTLNSNLLLYVFNQISLAGALYTESSLNSSSERLKIFRKWIVS